MTFGKSICSLLLILIIVHAINSQTSITDLAFTLCPYTDFCTRNASLDVGDAKPQLPSCQTCFCGNICTEYGRCCPDAQMDSSDAQTDIYSHNNPMLFSLSGNCYSHRVKNTAKGVPRIRPFKDPVFKIVEQCENNEYSELKDLCENENRSTLAQIVWVSHRINGRIFRNRFCALCNNIAESDFISWNILTSCKVDLFQSFEKMAGNLFSDDCEIILQPPQEIRHLVAVYQRVCDGTGYSDCNETGYWREFDDAIMKGCKTFNWPFITSTVVHKNIYCLMCNVRNVSEIFTVYATFEGKINLPYFSVLLAYTDVKLTDEIKKMADMGCGFEETLDKHTLSCRDLHCPFGSLPMFGECKSIALQTPVSVAINMKLLPNQPILWGVVSQINYTLHVLYSHFHDLLRFKDADCEFCEYSLWVDIRQRRTHSLIFWADFITDSHSTCSLDFVHRQIGNMVGRNLSMPVGSQVIPFQAVVETRSLEIINQTFKAVVVETKCLPKNKTAEYYRLREASQCPMIELDHEEIAGMSKETAEQILASFIKHDNGKNSSKIKICLDDYNSIVSQRGNNSSLDVCCHVWLTACSLSIGLLVSNSLS